MPLSAGARFGAYEILSFLGAGGMGEVYRARDMRLSRDAALKILPAEFAVDGERLARFKREAHMLASLNHPNIAAIYGIEASDGVEALVLELVEGPTLADRIAKGPVPVEDALPLARQIADALEAAHDQGIIHRDLKPANIKIRADGAVKVLDFGLAKLTEPHAASASQRFAVTQSPTITSPAMMTGIGVILGTAPYMSPEQAKGRPADKRSDIWAFGCVLYEMLTGKRAFDAEDVAETLALVMTRSPDWSALPTTVPAPARRHRRCSLGNRRRRDRDAGGCLVIGIAGQQAAPAARRGCRPARGRRYRVHRLDDRPSGRDVRRFGAGVPGRDFSAGGVERRARHAVYDAAADGQRFLVVSPVAEARLPSLSLIVNWPAALPH